MCSIKWDDKFFEETGLFIWIFNKGYLESTNDRFHKSNLLKSYKQKQEQGLNNLLTNKTNEKEKP